MRGGMRDEAFNFSTSPLSRPQPPRFLLYYWHVPHRVNRLTSVILSVGFLLLRDVVNETAVVADAAGVLKAI